MKIGVCVGDSVEKLEIAAKAGFDYAESHCQNIVKMSDETLEKFINSPIPVITANCFMGIRVAGDDKNTDEIKAYLDELFKRCKLIGIRIIVFGSSGARKMREGENIKQTREEITEFLKEFVVPHCEETGIMIAIEPLRPGECNVINTVPQAIDIAKRVNSPYVKVLADVKHMIESDDPLSVIPEYKNWLIHAHTSNPWPAPELCKKRIYPVVSDEFDQALFFDRLKEAGVELCSIEADVIDFEEDCKKSYEVLKKFGD